MEDDIYFWKKTIFTFWKKTIFTFWKKTIFTFWKKTIFTFWKKTTFTWSEEDRFLSGILYVGKRFEFLVVDEESSSVLLDGPPSNP